MATFSAVVPTRNRPELLAFCLESLVLQTLEDVEVVVSDNATTASARKVFERWARPGWRYVMPERPLEMHENFELACGEATGDYVAVLVDKTVLHPSALELAAQAVEPGVDIVSWWNEGYNPVDEHRDLAPGRFVPASESVSPSRYDPLGELTRRFANDERRGRDPVHYVRGKIVFGAFSRRLLDRIRKQTGRIFHPLAPDYTSMVPACVLADGAVDLGRPLLVSYNSMSSNGRRQAVDPAHARRFIEDVDPAILDALPIPRLYASQHNVVAYDLVSSAARCAPVSAPPLDVPNLLRRAREDLDGVAWLDPGERAAQYALLEAAEAEYGLVPEARRPEEPRSLRFRLGSSLARIPGVGRLRPASDGVTYASPVEAARAADRHYSLAGPA